MIRFVLGPDGRVVPDVRRKLPGRGVWIDAQRESVERAVKKRAFSRGFRTEAQASETLGADVAALLRQGALQRLAMAHKAGLVTLGFEKVRAALKSGQAHGLVVACDAAEDGVNKVQALAKWTLHRHNEGRLVDVFSSAELESLFGRSRVVHVALSPGRLSDLFFDDALRLRGYEGQPLSGARATNTDQQADEPNVRRTTETI